VYASPVEEQERADDGLLLGSFELSFKVRESNHHQFAAPVALHNDTPLFDPSRESAAEAPDILIGLGCRTLIHRGLSYWRRRISLLYRTYDAA